MARILKGYALLKKTDEHDRQPAGLSKIKTSLLEIFSTLTIVVAAAMGLFFVQVLVIGYGGLLL